MKQIKCKVVLLETQDKNSRIVMDDSSSLLRLELPKVALWGFRHLYILSDEEIKEGDWFYSDYNTPIERASFIHDSKGEPNPNGKLVNGFIREACKKIIATTEFSLDLPSPTAGFVRKYVDKYNKGEKIEDVLVDMEFKFTKNPTTGKYGRIKNAGEGHFVLKTSDFNEITIHPIKTSWSRDEVEALINRAVNESKDSRDSLVNVDINEWFKRTL